MNKPKTIEEWNALAAKRRAMQPLPRQKNHKPKQAKLSVSALPTMSLPLHVVQRPRKGKFKIKSYFMHLLWRKRGFRVFEDFLSVSAVANPIPRVGDMQLTIAESISATNARLTSSPSTQEYFIHQ